VSNPGFDWGDLLDDLLDGIDDLFPNDTMDPILACAREVARQYQSGTPEYDAAIKACAGRRPGGGSNPGTVVSDIKDDIGNFLDDLLGGLEENLDDVFAHVGDVLRGAVGGVGAAGERTIGDVGRVAGAILGDTGTAARGAIDIIGLTAGGAIDVATGTITDMAGGVLEGIEDFLKQIREAIESAIRAMSKAISDGLNAAISTVTKVVTNIVQQIQSVVTDAIESLTDLLKRVVDSVQELISSAVERITEVADAVFNAVSETVTNIRDAIVSAFDNITQFIGDSIEQAGQFINAATEQLQAIGSQIVDSAEQLYGSIATGIDRAISELTDTASGALAVVRQGLDNLQGAVTAALEGIGPVLQEAFTNSPQGIAAGSISTAMTAIQNTFSITLETPEDDLTKILRSIGVSEEAIKRVITMARPIFTDTPGLRSLFLILISVFIALAFAQQIAQAAGIKALQDVQPGFSVAVPDPGQVADMVHFGAMSEAEGAATLQKGGFSEADAERLAAIRQRLPDIGIIQVWFLRGFLSREDSAAMLGKLGLSPGDSQRILDMAFFIPPVSDLITMSVREVFSPAIAERFGQFQDFPEQFSQYAAQQGISEEWARNYWAAHWALPSVQMGFEMLHRGVIKQDDLELLLRAQDVMPFWRDKLIAISYTPLTRVDVRRMHKMGVLDDAAVKKAYKDIGYDDANAELLLQFTKELNRPAEGATPEQLDELTRSAITNLYGVGTLSRNDAFELLQAIGVGSAAAIIFLDMVDMRNESEDRAARTQLILDQAKAGIIRFSEAGDKLNALGLEPLEVQRALTKLQAAQDATVKLPSPQQLDDLLRAGLIPDVLYLDTMLRLGYSALWAERLMALAKKTT
jgi:ElaB/YqjD/DUF883 family membrane-anchored ribosome-binding protein/endonuclease III